jgi:pimeloyl-CoA dehydrogenase small subunit
MNFDLSNEQKLLQDSVERLVAERYGFEQRRQYARESGGWSRQMWALYAELGLLGLPFSEGDGGFGGSAVDTLLVCEAFGRGLILEPYFATVVLAGTALRCGANAQQRADLIPRIADGSLLLAFAHSERQARYDLANVETRAVQDSHGWRLHGSKCVVWHGDCADKLVVSARTAGQPRDRGGIALFLVDAAAAGITRAGYHTHDGLRAADIQLDDVYISADAVLVEADRGLDVVERVAQYGIAALAAEAVGAMQAALNITVDYLKTRNQFGAPLGSFQALQHRAAEMFVATEQARSIALYAAMMADSSDAEERAKAMAAAKIQIGKSSNFVGKQAIQLHGGIGVTEEYVVGHYFKRLTVMETILGDTDFHLAALARSGGFIAAERDA